MRWRPFWKTDVTNVGNIVRLCKYSSQTHVHCASIPAECGLFYFYAVQSHCRLRATALPPPPHPPPPLASGRVSKHQQASPCGCCVSGNEPNAGHCCETTGRRWSGRMENREKRVLWRGGCWLVRDEHCLADRTPVFAGIHALGCGCVHKHFRFLTKESLLSVHMITDHTHSTFAWSALKGRERHKMSRMLGSSAGLSSRFEAEWRLDWTHHQPTNL